MLRNALVEKLEVAQLTARRANDGLAVQKERCARLEDQLASKDEHRKSLEETIYALRSELEKSRSENLALDTQLKEVEMQNQGMSQ